jgi:ADP-ribose pyrophosphatase YjhB (NUDIX family)
MSGDGNGWVVCGPEPSHRHWGRFGAAGLLITDGERVVLQLRAGWVHEGGTWAVPGGARDSHEDAVTAALREAHEETTLDGRTVVPFAEHVFEHPVWNYTTVLAWAAPDLAIETDRRNGEGEDVRWWPLAEVERLRLHSGFAQAWPSLRETIVRAQADRAQADRTQADRGGRWV